MTDNEYASRIYCSVFCTDTDSGDAYVRGILNAISTLSAREQAVLESYYKHNSNYKQTGEAVGNISGEAARRTVQKALLKLRHPSRKRNMSVKTMIDERDSKIAIVASMVDELCEQMDTLMKKAVIIEELPPILALQKNSICNLGLSTRVFNHLLNAGLKTTDDLLALESLDSLMQRRNFGNASRIEIIDKMRQFGHAEWADRMEISLENLS